MPFTGRCLFSCAVVIPLAVMLLGDAHAVDPRFELDAKALDSGSGVSEPRTGGTRAKRVSTPNSRKTGGLSRYIVKPGDHLFRILMQEYGYAEKQAEALIPVVKRINGIADIRELKVGRVLSIPLRSPAKKGGEKTVSVRGIRGTAAGQAMPLQSYRLAGHGSAVNSPVASVAEQVWEKLVPSHPAADRGVEFGGDNFSLSIDPARFPTLVAQDGATILVDAGKRLPPLVKSLIQERGEHVRFVDGDPSDRKRFFASLLDAGRFFSVSEDFTADFGTDPQLTVTSDFKVEKTPESLLKQELVLLNVTEGRSGTPPGLVSFLNRQGFQVIEPYAAGRTHSRESGHRILRIGGAKVPDIADRLMSSLDIRYTRDSMVELYGPGDSGIRLDVRADRFFEVGGARYIVSYFNGDPVFYTLMRLLETRGYRVIILEERDDFRKVAEKLAGGIGMGGGYGRHSLWPSGSLPYNVRISGYMFRSQHGGGKVLLTDREIDPLISELAALNGYTVSSITE